MVLISFDPSKTGDGHCYKLKSGRALCFSEYAEPIICLSLIFVASIFLFLSFALGMVGMAYVAHVFGVLSAVFIGAFSAALFATTITMFL